MKSLLIYVFIFTILPLLSVEQGIYLFHTEDNDDVEYYDCIILDTIPYCRRPGSPFNLRRDSNKSACYRNGKNWTFEELRQQNQTPNQVVHEFRSSIEKAEEYVLYLSGRINSGSLCACQKRTFGKNCEYQIISETWHVTFVQSQKWQNDQKQKDRLQMQIYQKTLCYTTLACDYGLLCLDWRDICDGRQQCMNGTDEEACDLLEFNECEDEEYRCSNGMCIPDVYFLDGEYDCMDHSDEQRPFDYSACAYQPDPLNCDEHICAVAEWSCGDGQCIPEKNRYKWLESTTILNSQCHSMREYQYMCELSNRYKLWTSINGTCYNSSFLHSINERWNRYNQSSDEYCLYLVKCALSDGAEQNCPCKRLSCDNKISQACSSPIQYPLKGLLTPYLFALYNSQRKWSEKKQPDAYIMSGDIRCRGYHAKLFFDESFWIPTFVDINHLKLENMFCGDSNIWKDFHGPQFHPSCYANVSRTFGKRLPYAFFDVCKQCISQYRINDGVRDCLNGEDEGPQQSSTCTNHIRHHRFRCSSQFETCLLAKTLGNSIADCTDGDDEFVYGSGESLSKMKCEGSDNEECSFLREYILKSQNNYNNSTQTIANAKIPFRSYCNTFWDLKDQSDELLEICRSWICGQDEFQCGTGQCTSKYYVCDGEWDCADASDELFAVGNLSYHNQMVDLTEEQMKCIVMMSSKIQAFNSFCNITIEYPCLLINFTQQSDILHTRPCINISQIGDGRIDCLGGLDERNTQTHCHGMHQLGFAFQCRSKPIVCIDEHDLCINTSRCENPNDDLLICGNQYQNTSDALDFHCMNGTSVRNGRCNEMFDCEYAEDEYWCSSDRLETGPKQYRLSKRQDQLTFKKFVALPTYPFNVTEAKVINENEQKNLVKRSTSIYVPPSIAALMCNRGVAVSYYTNITICFCPPSYYGDYCQYHSDRITSYVHLNFSQSPYAHSSVDVNILWKVLVLFIHENQVIHSHQFHSRPSYDLSHRIKKKHHLIYSREAKLFEKKIHRIHNRTSIVDHSPYYLQYEAYELKPNNIITFMGVWRYSIFFDFLPSFRLAKILHYLDRRLEVSNSPCQSNPCNSSNAECHILQNDLNKYVCLCKSGYSGEHCSIQDHYCANNFCHPNSLCKANYLGSTTGNRLPFCLCPLDVYGTRCGLSYDQCLTNPCKNNGTCFASTSDITKSNCLCNKDYYGDVCQTEKEKIELTVRKNNVTGVSVIQYFYIEFTTLDISLAHQIVLEQPSDYLHYRYAKTYAPHIVLLKNYRDMDIKYPRIFLLHSTMNKKNINASTTLTDTNLCFNVAQVFKNISVYQYHTICRNNSSSLRPLCFFDDAYLCICEINNYRAECFRYDHQFDQCDYCYSGGRCIRGDLQNNNNFLCLCTKCHYGHLCQYSSEDFSFTFEQIFAYSLLSTTPGTRQLTSYIMILVACIYFIIGAFNNLFTFITFYRSKFLRNGVGNYLLVGCVVNQITLSSLSFRIIHVVLSTTGYMSTVSATVNKILCKSMPYALASSGQLSYWLMSTVAIERLYITWNIKGTWLKKPYVARRIMFILTIFVLLINAPQIAFYTLLIDTKTEIKTMTCVLIYSHHYWIRLNQVNNYINNLLPLIINMTCTGGIMFLITRQKLLANTKSDSSKKTTYTQTASVMNEIKPTFENESNIDKTDGKRYKRYIGIKSRWNFFRTVLHENMDLIFGPAITIVPQLFCLPQLIFSSTMDCQDFSNITIRYSFIISLSILFIPQLTSFFLYVRFSSVYYAHFRSTTIGRKMVFLCNYCRRRRTNQQINYSDPSRYTIKFENNLTIVNTDR